MRLSRDHIKSSLTASVDRFKSRNIYLKNKFNRLGLIKLAVFTLFVISFFTLFFVFDVNTALFSVILFIPLGILTQVQNKTGESIMKNGKWVEIKQELLARLSIDWENIPYRTGTDNDIKHPFAYDLSVSGKYSIQHLIDTSVTTEGQKALLDRLLEHPADPLVTVQRQKLIKELKEMEHFRLKLMLAGRLTSAATLNGSKVNAIIGKHTNSGKYGKILAALSFLIPINLILFTLWGLNIIQPYFLLSTLVYLAVYFFNSRHTKELFDQTLSIEEELGRFYKIFTLLENYRYGENKVTADFCSLFRVKNGSPGYYFKQLDRINFALSFQKNPLTALLLNFIFPWNFYFAYKLELVKEELSGKIDKWMKVWYELEAANSLATFSSLNPDYSFPHLDAADGGFFLDAAEAGHPLIPFEKNVNNTFSFKGTGKVFIITGSNMSGKSTFLKTLGTNLILANAGSAVNASGFRYSPMRLFTCININDSVTDGISYFYAEVKRLKQLLDEVSKMNELPVFYLVDEIFKGTNNRERLEGSRAFITELLKQNGSGLITTHDLELTALESSEAVVNLHFREEAFEDKLVFDYKLRSGPCPTTNALKIMKQEGLPVSI